jgi:hypothetical protein
MLPRFSEPSTYVARDEKIFLSPWIILAIPGEKINAQIQDKKNAPILHTEFIKPL